MHRQARIVVALAALVAFTLLLTVIRGGTPSASSGSGVPTSPIGSGETGASAGRTPAPGASATGSIPSPGGAPTAAAVIPAFAHAYVVVMENKEASAIIGNPAAPYINGLASQYGLAAAYTAVTHPSQPNYLALWSGSTQGVSDDRAHDFATGTTLADELEASGRTWHVAAENVPAGCFRGDDASGGPDGPGTYARKHEPAISWLSVAQDPARCSNIVGLRQFDPAVGDFWLVVPNLCHDMHDCSVAAGDAWLRGWLPAILHSPAFADGVVFLTWDEGSSDVGGGGRVATIVISPLAKAGFTSTTPHDHYSLLHTIQVAWDLPCLAATCRANDLRELFR